MRIIPRVLVVAAMLFAMFVLIEHVKDLQKAAEATESGQVEMSKLVSFYVGILGLAVTTALVFCISLLPLLGEFVGNFMFTPNQQIERSPHADALAKLAAGDLPGAIEEYRAVFDDNPQDTHAASEIVRLYCDKLHDPEPAASFLVEALSYSERTQEEIAFLSERLVDVCWLHQHDGLRARAILIKIAEDMPETREAANAMHRLQEIDRAINESTFMAQQPGAGPTNMAEAEPEPPQTGV